MMFKESIELSRKWLANQHQDLSLSERLKLSKAVDLRDNFKIIEMGNNYDLIRPIDPEKRFI
jgi:hypothetical protein